MLAHLAPWKSALSAGNQPTGLAVELGAVVTAVQVHGQLAGAARQLVMEGQLGPLPGRAPLISLPGPICST